MDRIVFSLCTVCEHCPELIITDNGVTIGEAGNIVRLNHAEWRELVRLIQSWKLPEPNLERISQV
jgi:hypothetical protein